MGKREISCVVVCIGEPKQAGSCSSKSSSGGASGGQREQQQKWHPMEKQYGRAAHTNTFCPLTLPLAVCERGNPGEMQAIICFASVGRKLDRKACAIHKVCCYFVSKNGYSS